VLEPALSDRIRIDEARLNKLKTKSLAAALPVFKSNKALKGTE